MFNILNSLFNSLFYNNDERRLAQRLSLAKIVLYGPFQGLRYPYYKAYDSVLIPKLLGTYEKELHQWVLEIIEKQYKKIINIGCAEGYYAIGFALRVPTCNVWALDISTEALAYCRKMAKVNGVEKRVNFLKMPNTSAFKKLLTARTFIFADCEGNEIHYFNLKKFPELSTCSFLVELHEIKHPHERTWFVRNFRRTHLIKVIHARQRQLADVPTSLRSRIHETEIIAMNEFRNDGYSWIYAKSKLMQ